MTSVARTDVEGTDAKVSRLGLLLAAAMFVLVFDTSLMNVSISAVVEDLDTTVSGVQVGDRPGGVGFRSLHPDQQQGR